MNKGQDNLNISRTRPGVVLLVTLVLLVVLATLGYTLSVRVTSQRHRNQYIIDYSNARYGCDSAVKYALATLEELEPELVSRPNEPDFSDLFALDEIGYQELLAQWGIESQSDTFNSGKNFDDKSNIDDVNGISRDESGIAGFNDPDSLVIRGPYGPPWPFVTEPTEFEIGSANVQIEIEDENAKYPLGWALMNNPELKRETEAGFETFCEMMRLDFIQIDSLREQLKQIGEIKPFTLTFKTITKTVRTPITTTAKTTRKSSTSRTPRPRITRKTISVTKQISDQTTHFAKMFHSSLIDMEPLAQPTIVVGDRKEFPLKYIGLWGTRQVNINTAPRHVLEAAFIFGGNQVEIAEEIIQQRREEPFANIEDFKNKLSRYSESVGKCEEYITTESRFFTIKITSTSGVAKASSMIAITKDGNKVTRIAVING
ncbi:MAG: type II secretion system protein GspK [Sedimentisphaerales bacterium]